MNQNMRVARLMAFLGLYAAQESGAADAGLLARLYPARLSLADAAELAGLSEEEPARYLREWLYNRRKTPKADRQSTQKALYEALTDYYTEARLPTDQPLDMQMNLADLATFFENYAEACETALSQKPEANWALRLVQEVLADMVEKAAINNETLMAVAQGYFKAKTFAGLCSTGPMAGELLSCADMAAYRRENLEAWAADVDLPAALGDHFTPESLEALDVQAIQAKIDDIAEHLGAIDEAICKVSKKWRPDRMASCDRTILRLGVYDLCYAPEKADTALIINEAVELAKIYGDEDAYKFVNGVLDAIAKTRETV